MSDFFSAPPISLDASSDPTPKYLRISQIMTEAIEAGRLRPGSALPSHDEMAVWFGVTRMTLRQALKMLAAQGYLSVVHGRGTFVAERAYVLPLDGLSSFVQQIVDAGRALRSEILAASVIPAPQGVPARMGLDTSSVFCVTRLRWVDDVPLVYSMSLLSTELGQQLDLDLLGRRSLYDVLATQFDIVVSRATETFHASALAEPEASALGRPVGSPALVSSRLTFTIEDIPVVDDRAIMPGDGVFISTERRVNDLDLSLRLKSDGAIFESSTP